MLRSRRDNRWTHREVNVKHARWCQCCRETQNRIPGVLTSCGCPNKRLETQWLQTTWVYSPAFWRSESGMSLAGLKQGVIRAVFLLEIPGRVCSHRPPHHPTSLFLLRSPNPGHTASSLPYSASFMVPLWEAEQQLPNTPMF